MDGGSLIQAPAGRALDDDLNAIDWHAYQGRDLGVCPPEGSGLGAMFYLTDLREGWVALLNPALKLGLAMAWDPEVFPVVWIWQEANGNKNYPYFGGAHAVALEPFSSLPGARRRGDRLLRLEGGASLSTRLALAAFEGIAEVTSVSRDGKVSGAPTANIRGASRRVSYGRNPRSR
jgi:hypothetical protein